MFNHELFAVTFARAVHVMGALPPVPDQQKAALRAVHTLTSIAPAAVRVYEGVLSIDDVAIPGTLPHVMELINRLTAHRVAEIAIARGAAPGDLLALLRALATARDDLAAGDTVERRVRDSGATSVAVISMSAPDDAAGGRRARSITQAFEMEATLAEADAAWPAPPTAVPEEQSWSGPGLREIDLGFTSEDFPVVQPPAEDEPGAEPPAAEPAAPAAPLPVTADTPLGRSLAAVMAEPYSMRALDLLTAFSVAFADAVADDVALAVRAAAAVIELEPGAPEGTPRNSYSIVLRRMMPREVLAQVAPLLLTADAPFAIRVLHRAGAPAVDILLGLLAAADSIRERKAYMAALGGMPEGTERVLTMLDHPQWYVVRNVADLCGTLRLEAAVPDLARLLGHADARVQRAAAVALARVGSIDTVAPLLEVIKQPKPELRRQVAAALAAAPELASLPVLTALAGDGDKGVAGAAKAAIEALRQRASRPLAGPR